MTRLQHEVAFRSRTSGRRVLIARLESEEGHDEGVAAVVHTAGATPWEDTMEVIAWGRDDEELLERLKQESTEG